MDEFENTRNPILPIEVHVPDCEAHRMPDGKLYLYGSYDAREDAYCSEEYHVISTPDMVHWTVHDCSLDGKSIGWYPSKEAQEYPEMKRNGVTPFVKKTYIRNMKKKIARKLLHRQPSHGAAEKAPGEDQNPALLYAPDCAGRNGAYYLYFCMSDSSEGVAVSARPEGPFSDPVQLPCGGIDPTVFVDEDGQAYYYWGQFSAQGVKLNGDMVSFDRENIVCDLVTEREHYFHEGSSVRKIGDTYYYIFSDMQRGKPTALGYATGPSPLGPFAYQGIIIDNDGCDPESWNNHGSIEQFHGQWYVFYHRSSRGSRLHRRLCIEPITIDSKGRIAEVPMTSQGVGKPFASGEEILAYRACGLKGALYIGTDETFGESLKNIENRDEAIFRYVESDAGFQYAEVVCRGTGIIEIMMDGKKVGSAVSADGGDGRYHTVLGKLNCPAGKATLTLRFQKAKDFQVGKITLWDRRPANQDEI